MDTADTIILSEGALLIYLHYRVEKLLSWLGIQSTTLDLSSQSGAFDHLAMTNSMAIKICNSD